MDSCQITSGSDLREHQRALLTLLQAFADVCEQYNISYMLYAGTMLGAVRHQGFIPWDDDIDVILPREDYERFLSIAPQILDANQFYVQKEYSPHWPMFFSKLRLQHTACMEKFVPKDPLLHQGIYMDIFPCDQLSDSGLKRKLQFLASKIVIARGLQQRGYATNSILKKAAMKLSMLCPCKMLHKYVIHRSVQQTKYVHTFFAAASRYQKNVFPRSWFEKTIPMRFEGREYPVSSYYDEMLTVLYGDYRKIPSPEERKCKEHNFIVDVHRSYEEYIGYQENQEIDVYYRSIR